MIRRISTWSSTTITGKDGSCFCGMVMANFFEKSMSLLMVTSLKIQVQDRTFRVGS